MTAQHSLAVSWNKDDWTSLTEMADGFDEYRPPLSRALVGRRIELDCREAERCRQYPAP